MERRAHPFENGPSSNKGVGFDYEGAFSRNIGWITQWEQQELRKKTVAIAGMGGVGGQHALTLARLGIGGLHIADLDQFDVPNMNRQAGAFVSTIGLEKTAVMARMTRDINPELRQKIFGGDRGVDDQNIDEFLSGVDLFVDGFDFFVLDIRRKVFKRCAELGIPAITAAPIGFGACYVIFMPGGMTFEEYFRFEGLPEKKQYVNFALGLTPKGLHRAYLVDPYRIDLAGKRGPSTAVAIQLCAGVVGAEAVKLLLGQGKVHAAPAYHAFDAYSQRFVRGYLRHGNAGPLQRLKLHVGYKIFGERSRNSRPHEDPVEGSEIERILDVARWAPSGDNSQPWRFKILGEDRVQITITCRNDNIYEYADGEPTLLAAGFLLETIRIAASRFGRALQWTYLGSKKSANDVHHTIEANLPKALEIREDNLCPYIDIRSVDRRAYRRTRLTPQQKAELEAALGGEFRLEWRESLSARWSMARLNAMATDIRLRLPQAFPVHQKILDWNRRFSPEGVPAAAVGVDPLTLKLMRFVLHDWRRADFFNRFLAGTVIPRIQLDLYPGLSCAAHFVVSRKTEPPPEDATAALFRTGQALQRFWLTATRMGLAVQPGLAPLCFAYYGRVGGPPSVQARIAKSDRARITELARKASDRFTNDGTVLFLGRIGVSRRVPTARSIRRSVADLTD
jgi:molybdopterin/thiamine biosynthesis adenylyltransferase/nitroreductase